MTQYKAIENYMTQNGSITAMDGFRLGITKITTRVNEMRKAGWNIIDEWEESTNQYGEKVRYKRYRVVKEDDRG